MATDRDGALQRLLLRDEIERFLIAEADLLDARRFEDWLALFTEDIRLFMPLARNVPTERLADESVARNPRKEHLESLEALLPP